MSLFLLLALLNTRFCYAHPCYTCFTTSIEVGNNHFLTESNQQTAAIPLSFPQESWLNFIEGMAIGLLLTLLGYYRMTHNEKYTSYEKYELALNAIHKTKISLALIQNLLEDVDSAELPDSVSDKIKRALGCAKDAMNHYLPDFPGYDFHRDVEEHPAIESPGPDPENSNEVASFMEEDRIGDLILKDEDSILFMKKVDALLEQNLSENKYLVPKLSADMGKSNTGFFNKIKAITGKAPLAYILSYKMYKARKLLAAQEHSITAIAVMLGYNDSKYFGKVFKKFHHISPTDYVKSLMK